MTIFLSAVGLADITGQNLLDSKNISIAPGKLGTVAIFLSTKCPCSNSHVPIIKSLAADFKDFSFVVIHSNSDEDTATAKTYFQNVGFNFPVLQDDHTKLADAMKAYKTPHAFIIAPDGRILYKGGVTSSAIAQTADKQFLRNALADIEAGKAVETPEGRTLGCIISRENKNVW